MIACELLKWAFPGGGGVGRASRCHRAPTCGQLGCCAPDRHPGRWIWEVQVPPHPEPQDLQVERSYETFHKLLPKGCKSRAKAPMLFWFFAFILNSKNPFQISFSSWKQVQVDLRDIVGSVPDHHNKASHTGFLASQRLYKLCLHCTAVC